MFVETTSGVGKTFPGSKRGLDPCRASWEEKRLELTNLERGLAVFPLPRR
jgi:hypothetical protein